MNDRRPLVDRFWAKVDKSAGPTGCWLWTAAKRSSGYGCMNVGGNRVVDACPRAHAARGSPATSAARWSASQLLRLAR